MNLQTTVDLPQFPFTINHKDKLTFIGSCFAENMGQKFKQNKFSSLINPYGVLYNPASVSQCLNSLLADDFDDSQLIAHDGLWHSFLHHGSFSHIDKETCSQHINAQKNIAKQHLLESNYLFITLGTAHIFEYEGTVVSNCHKLPAKTFTRRRLSIQEIVAQLGESIKTLREINPTLKIIFTVSPVRYSKDGLAANSLSKATLLLAIEKLCQTSNTYYFPAYEIVVDELRDYRFFAEDMTHPNNTAITYLWKKIESCLFDRQTLQLNQQVSKIITASQHRPFNTNPEAHQLFLASMFKKTNTLQEQNPSLDLSEELAYFGGARK